MLAILIMKQAVFIFNSELQFFCDKNYILNYLIKRNIFFKMRIAEKKYNSTKEKK